jgi:hypothetical protein
MKKLSLHSALAVLLAWNYFAFQAEPFDDEYEANNPTPADQCAYSRLSLNWETFDKQNAQQAFVFDAGLRTEPIFILHLLPHREFLLDNQALDIRDKSPPLVAAS